jgi:hypothetical protein
MHAVMDSVGQPYTLSQTAPFEVIGYMTLTELRENLKQFHSHLDSGHFIDAESIFNVQ